MTTLTQARTAVYDALKAASLPWPVHSGPVHTLQPPCVVIVPGEPWVDDDGRTAALEVACIAPLPGGPLNTLGTLEGMLTATRDALRAAGIAPGAVAKAGQTKTTYEARYAVEQAVDC